MIENDSSFPSFSAVEAMLTELNADMNTPFNDDVLMIFAALVGEATEHNPTARIDAAALARGIFYSFWSGYRAANAQRDAAELERLFQK